MSLVKDNFSQTLVCHMADQLELYVPSFNRDYFLNAIFDEMDLLELKERVQLITDQLHRVLPQNYKKRYTILKAMMHPLEDADQSLQTNKDGIRGWGMLPLCAVVGQHGLRQFNTSLALLKEMTKRFSSEFDIRYFLLADQDRALAIMARWLKDPNRHVRRLVSEGSRPRLPWAMQLPQLIQDPNPTLPLLQALLDDKEEYVRRSVANHLNDISKDHPDLVAELANSWFKPQIPARQKLLRHACRTLIKQGHPLALELFGYHKPNIQLQRLELNKTSIKMGSAIEISIKIKSLSKSNQSLLIDDRNL